MEELTGNHTDKDKTIETPRDIYLKRREGLEAAFMQTAPSQEIVELPDGARTNVLSNVYKVPPEYKKAPVSESVIDVTVFVPGMFKTDKPNTGNAPTEVKLAGSLLAGEADAVVMLKGEGLNKEAYLNADGSGACERKVTEASLTVLRSIVDGLKTSPDQKIRFRVLGYSEGSTQGPSLAARIVEAGLGDVAECVTVCGGGLTGVSDQTKAEVVPVHLVRDNMKKMKEFSPPQMPTIVRDGKETTVPFQQIDDHTYYIDKRLMGDSTSGGFEGSLGKAEIRLGDDLENVGRWVKDFLATQMGFSGQVPKERLQALWTRNPDYELLAEKGVPLKVLGGYSDIFFNGAEVAHRVEELRKQYPQSHIDLITSNIAHDYPHNNPSGTAYAIKILTERPYK